MEKSEEAVWEAMGRKDACAVLEALRNAPASANAMGPRGLGLYSELAIEWGIRRRPETLACMDWIAARPEFDAGLRNANGGKSQYHYAALNRLPVAHAGLAALRLDKAGLESAVESLRAEKRVDACYAALAEARLLGLEAKQTKGAPGRAAKLGL